MEVPGVRLRWSVTRGMVRASSRQQHYFKVSEDRLQYFDRSSAVSRHGSADANTSQVGNAQLEPQLEGEISLCRASVRIGKDGLSFNLVDGSWGPFRTTWCFEAVPEGSDSLSDVKENVGELVRQIHEAKELLGKGGLASSLQQSATTRFMAVGDTLQGPAKLYVAKSRRWYDVYLKLRPQFTSGYGQGIGQLAICAMDDMHRHDDHAAVVLHTGARTMRYTGTGKEGLFEVEAWRNFLDAPDELVPPRLRSLCWRLNQMGKGRTTKLTFDVSSDAGNRDAISDFLSTQMRFIVPRAFALAVGVPRCVHSLYHFEPHGANEVLCHQLEYSLPSRQGSAVSKMSSAWVVMHTIQTADEINPAAGWMPGFASMPLATQIGSSTASDGAATSAELSAIATAEAVQLHELAPAKRYAISLYEHLDSLAPLDLRGAPGSKRQQVSLCTCDACRALSGGTIDRARVQQTPRQRTAMSCDDSAPAPPHILLLDKHTQVTAVWYPRRLIEIVRTVNLDAVEQYRKTLEAVFTRNATAKVSYRAARRATEESHGLPVYTLDELQSEFAALHDSILLGGAKQLCSLRLRAPDLARHEMWLSGLIDATQHWAHGSDAHSARGQGASPVISGAMATVEALSPSVSVTPMYPIALDSSLPEAPDVQRALASLRECLKQYLVQSAIRSEMYDVLGKALFVRSAESILIRRLTIAFLKLTAERVPGGKVQVRVPIMQQGRNARWMRYAEAYGMWLLAFVNPRVPMGVDAFPEPPLARVRAVFLCCDVQRAVQPFFHHLRQEAKTTRLQELVNAMLLWTSATSTDPTEMLYMKLDYPQPGSSADTVAAFLHEQPSRRVDEFMQLRLLLDARHSQQAVVLGPEDNPSSFTSDGGAGSAADESTVDVELGGTQMRTVTKLVAQARRRQLAEGYSGEEQTISFLPFHNHVETVKGVGHWPLQLLSDPRSRAALFIELVRLGFYSGSHWNVTLHKQVARDSFEEAQQPHQSADAERPTGSGEALLAAGASAPWAMAKGVLEFALFGPALAITDSTGRVGNQRAFALRIKREDREHRKEVVEIWTAALFREALARLGGPLTSSSTSPLLSVCYEVIELLCMAHMRPGVSHGCTAVLRAMPQDHRKELMQNFFLRHFRLLLKHNVRSTLRPLAEGYKQFRQMVTGGAEGTLFLQQLSQQEHDWLALCRTPAPADASRAWQAARSAAGQTRAELGRTGVQEGLAILGLIALVVQVNDAFLLRKILGELVRERELFTLCEQVLVAQASRTASDDESGIVVSTDAMPSVMNYVQSLARGMTTADVHVDADSRVQPANAAEVQYLKAILDAMFGAGEFGGAADPVGDVGGTDQIILFHPAFREQMPQIMASFKHQLWRRDMLFLYTPGAFEDGNEAHALVRNSIRSLLRGGNCHLVIAYASQVWQISQTTYLRAGALSKDGIYQQLANCFHALLEFEHASHEQGGPVAGEGPDAPIVDVLGFGEADNSTNTMTTTATADGKRRWELFKTLLRFGQSEGSYSSLLAALSEKIDRLQKEFDLTQEQLPTNQQRMEDMARMSAYSRHSAHSDGMVPRLARQTSSIRRRGGADVSMDPLAERSALVEDSEFVWRDLTPRHGGSEETTGPHAINPSECLMNFLKIHLHEELEQALEGDDDNGMIHLALSPASMADFQTTLLGTLKLVNCHPKLLKLFGQLAPRLFTHIWRLVPTMSEHEPNSPSVRNDTALMTASEERKAALRVFFPPPARRDGVRGRQMRLVEKAVFAFDERFANELALNNELLASPHFWTEHSNHVLGRTSLEKRYGKLMQAQYKLPAASVPGNNANGAPEMMSRKGDFYMRLFKLCFKLETLMYHNRSAEARARDEPEPEEKVVKSTHPILDEFDEYPDRLDFLMQIFDHVSRRAQQSNWEEAFRGFSSASLKEMAANGVYVTKEVGESEDMRLAKEALLRLFSQYLENEEPKDWAAKFSDAAKMAYMLKYMFREDVPLAQMRFREALRQCPDKKDNPFGSEKQMFDQLLESSLDKYGPHGLVNQKRLVETNFLTQQDELVQTVIDGVRDKGQEVQLLGQLTAEWMKMQIEKNKMPLTPHHTQVLAMLMFSQFYKNQKDLSRTLSEGGFNYNAAIMQMKTGEGKSIVIAMLAIFVVKLLQKRVHVLENNEGLLIRDYHTYKEFYERFGLTTNDRIDAESDVCYCLKKHNNKFFNQLLVEGKLDLSNVILIVDEVDDLVISEKPSISYMKRDEEKTPAYKDCYKALIDGHGQPANVNDEMWKACKRVQKIRNKKKPGRDYAAGGDRWEMLERLADGTSRRPKVALTDDWLEFLNFEEKDIQPKKQTFFTTLCTPYMYTKYACIFGLTGSVGGNAEREYIKRTYRAVAYEVPQFLKTCRGTDKPDAICKGLWLLRSRDEQFEHVNKLVQHWFKKVPVLVICRNSAELNDMHDCLKMTLIDVEPRLMEDEENLQKLREVGDRGELLDSEWMDVIKRATWGFGTGNERYYCVTVTDYFGGRGHDFDVMDNIANRNGGMLVIMTSIPDTREWIQWKGRTARQDRPGMYTVVLCERDPPFTPQDHKGRELTRDYAYIDKFKSLSDPDKQINDLLERKDKWIRDLLDKYQAQQAKGAWLNELCEKFYAKYPRGIDQQWPSEEFAEQDKKLRDMLSTVYENGSHIRDMAQRQFPELSLLRGPRPEWNFHAEKDFGETRIMPKTVLFVLDASYSMDEPSDGAEAQLSGNDLDTARELRRRRTEKGGELGGLTISLMWNTLDDLDLYVLSAGGEKINFSNKKSRCGGELDVDMNYQHPNISEQPVENCYWGGEAAPPGTYKWWVQNNGIRSDKSRSEGVEYTVQVQQGGVMKMFHGRVGPSQNTPTTPQYDVVYPTTPSHDSRLKTCKRCIESIIENNCTDADSVGFISFANEPRWDSRIVPLASQRATVVSKVRNLRTRGRTAYYHALSDGIKEMARRAAHETKWVIALTDGADTESKASNPNRANDVRDAINHLQKTPNLNLALITLGDEADQDVLRQLTAAAQKHKEDNENDTIGIHLAATDLTGVKEAFASIAEEMDTGGGAAG